MVDVPEKQIRLTKNEKEVLKLLIDQGRISDTEISRALPVSQQGVYQIRKRLEESGVIQGYMPIIDFKKIGITMFHFAGIQVLPELWKTSSESEIRKKICEIPFLFMAFRISSADISYLLIFGFRNIVEAEGFAKRLETDLAGLLKIAWSYTAGVENIMAHDTLNLVFHALSDGDDIRKAVERIKSGD